MTDIRVYGKSTCKTTQKALEWLKDHDVEIDYVDIISSPPTPEFLKKNIHSDNLKTYLNSRSKIYREKSLGVKLPSKEEAISMMLEDPNLIKRPLIVSSNGVSFGFDEDYLNELA